jgi:hypothetical protein
MLIARKTLLGCAITAAVVGVGAIGCGNETKASQSPPSAAPSSGAASSSSPAGDHTSLLMKPNDIGGDFNAARPAVPNPNGADGVEQLFANPDNSRRIDDTILVFADPAAATAHLADTKIMFEGKVSGAWQPADVGTGGLMISGRSPQSSVTVLLFTAGRALVSLEFEGASNDPIDPAVAADIGRKQEATIKSGLPG